VWDGTPAVADTFCPAGLVAVWEWPNVAVPWAGLVGEVELDAEGADVEVVTDAEGVEEVADAAVAVVPGEADPLEEQPAPTTAIRPTSPTPTNRRAGRVKTPQATARRGGTGPAWSAGFDIDVSA
jgi:hypothetical protein